MSKLHSRPGSHLSERLHRTTVSLADALWPCRERAHRGAAGRHACVRQLAGARDGNRALGD
jgi:hypothetical protein